MKAFRIEQRLVACAVAVQEVRCDACGVAAAVGEPRYGHHVAVDPSSGMELTVDRVVLADVTGWHVMSPATNPKAVSGIVCGDCSNLPARDTTSAPADSM